MWSCYNYTVRHQIFSEVWLVISRRFCCTEYKSGGQIGLSYQNFEKIEVKCVKKDNFDHIHYTIMAKIIFFLNYNGAILKC